MLTIKVETPFGSDLREAMYEMLDLAERTNCRVMLTGNETTFVVKPGDTLDQINSAFERLYPASKFVATHITTPVPRT